MKDSYKFSLQLRSLSYGYLGCVEIKPHVSTYFLDKRSVRFVSFTLRPLYLRQHEAPESLERRTWQEVINQGLFLKAFSLSSIEASSTLYEDLMHARTL
jgi:hypothetical protein